MTKIQNPFDNEENLKSWFNSDSLYQNSKKSSLNNFKQSNNYKTNIFMSFKDSYTNFVNTVTKHSILATLIMLLALGGVGASAAQLVAPEEFKPSTIIQKVLNPKTAENTEVKEQKNKKVYTALKPDENYDVTNLKDCNISVKYPKQIGDKKIDVFKFPDFKSLDNSTNNKSSSPVATDTSLYRISSDSFNTTEPNNNLNDFYLTCSKQPIIPGDVNQDPYTTPVSKETFNNLTNWFVGIESDLEQLRKSSDQIRGPYNFFYFKFENIYYNVSFSSKNINPEDLKNVESDVKQYWDETIKKPGLFGNQIQIQFNSLAENQANAEALQAKTELPDGETITQDFNFIGSINSGKGDDKFNTILEDENKVNYLIVDLDTSKFATGKVLCQDNTKTIYSLTATMKIDPRITEFMDGQNIETFYTLINLKDIKISCIPTSKPSANSSSSSVPTTNKNLQTYTNPFFPDFKLVYDSSWKFETSTKSSYLPGLLDRKITLSKNNNILVFNLEPIPLFGCGIGLGQPNFKKITDFPNGLKKVAITEGSVDGNPNVLKTNYTNILNTIVYTSNVNDIGGIVCQAENIKTTIKASKEIVTEFPNYKNGEIINYNLRINQPDGVNYTNAIKVNNPLISEIDQIISQSTFK